jgi:CHAT domain-containing protein
VQPAETPPHITWCATGPLAFLPIHAAGDYGNRKGGFKIYNYIVSSYTPTLSALLTPPTHLEEFQGLLVVAQEMTPGKSYLPGAVKELEIIQKKAIGFPFRQLTGSEATIDAVLRGMESCSWVHLACHATQDAEEPTESGFYLHDGKLDLATITKKRLKHARLAFLSACQTAVGHKDLPEEAIHLAAGMVMAGYPTVIATMWSIKDKDAPLIAERMYAEIFKGGMPEGLRAAEALHKAVADLRGDVGESNFQSWAPFIHIGL